MSAQAIGHGGVAGEQPSASQRQASLWISSSAMSSAIALVESHDPQLQPPRRFVTCSRVNAVGAFQERLTVLHRELGIERQPDGLMLLTGPTWQPNGELHSLRPVAGCDVRGVLTCDILHRAGAIVLRGLRPITRPSCATLVSWE